MKSFALKCCGKLLTNKITVETLVQCQHKVNNSIKINRLHIPEQWFSIQDLQEK